MPALAGNYNITADQGATFTLVIFRKDRRKRIAPFTANDIRMQVRDTSRDRALVLEANLSNGRIFYSGADARIDVAIDHTTMSAISEGSYIYDLEIEFDDSTVERMMMGKFTVRGEVTR